MGKKVLVLLTDVIACICLGWIIGYFTKKELLFCVIGLVIGIILAVIHFRHIK